jgi:drug/metabolite transporter (DMT)-like permease
MACPLRLRAELALAAVTILWGASFTLVKTALSDVSTLLFLTVRFLVGSAALATAFRLRGPLGFGGSFRAGFQAGICLFAAYFLQTFGLRLTTASKSAFLTSLCTALVPLLGACVYRSVPQHRELLGAALAVCGTALMTLPGAELAVNWGDVLTIGAAAAFALHILTVGHYAGRADLEGLSVVQLFVVAVLAGVTFPWAESFYLRWSLPVVAAVLVTGLFCTALAFTVQVWAQRHTTAVRTALIFALEPISAMVTSYLAEGEVLTARAASGAALVLAGVLAVQWKPRVPVTAP